MSENTAGVDETTTTPPSPMPPSTPLTPGPAPKPWIDGVLRKKATAVLFITFVVLISLFGDEGRRNSAVSFINDDVQPRVERLYPLELYDVFNEHQSRLADRDSLGERGARSLGMEYRSLQPLLEIPGYTPPQFQPPSTLTKMLRIPTSMWAAFERIIAQGVIGLIVLGIPAVLVFVILTGAVLSKQPVGVINPAFWALFLLSVGLAAYIVKAVTLGLLFVAEQTILACAVLATIYVLYEKYQLYDKMRDWLDVILQRPASTAPPGSA